HVAQLLKRETTGTCYAISAKRYAIYETHAAGTGDGAGGARTYNKLSQHGLGRFLDPTDPDHPRLDDGSRAPRGTPIWIRQMWDWMLDSHTAGHDLPLPAWADRPALSRFSVSSPALWRPFSTHNADKTYAHQIKPA